MQYTHQLPQQMNMGGPQMVAPQPAPQHESDGCCSCLGGISDEERLAEQNRLRALGAPEHLITGKNIGVNMASASAIGDMLGPPGIGGGVGVAVMNSYMENQHKKGMQYQPKVGNRY
mmetsp:Transcript_43678/g.70065  ORF Transcript_43678/g.70065 Transcript_43678/m.70065 type:complete len:117 (-) Transcript_43678:220-570(-)